MTESASLGQTLPEVSIVEAVAIPATVGQRLRAAREAAGLGVGDVAQSLKYSVRQVELIEADNYAALPGITIVRGFVRSYARLLRIDADVLLHMLEDRLPNTNADVRPPDNMGAASQPGDKKGIPMIGAAAIVLALAATMLALWHYLGPTPTRQAATTPASSVAQKADGTEASGIPAVQQPASAEPKANSEAVREIPALPPQLVFAFEGRSWIEVTDGNKKMIHTGENLAGSELKLGGQPPFDIVVGNAAKVRLMYGDRPVDLVPHTRAEVARLKVE